MANVTMSTNINLTPPTATPEINHSKNQDHKSNPKPLTFADLFAGIGGFHLALHQLGAKCVFASEINQYARQTYYENFKTLSSQLFNDIQAQSFNKDINDVNIDALPDFDILTAGFPCQAFSISGKQLGLQDTRGTLFFRIAEIINTKKPKVVFLENVKNMVTHNKGQTFELFLKNLRDLGYTVYYKTLRSSDFGVPQARDRVYIVCFLKTLKVNSFSFPDPLQEAKVVKDILDKNVADKIIRNDVRLYLNKQPPPDIRQPFQIGYFGKNRIGERIYSINHAGVTLMAFGGGMASKTGAYLVDGIIRKLTPRECARMHGYPENFQIPVSPAQARQQFGNSVSIPVVSHIFANIKQALQAHEQ